MSKRPRLYATHGAITTAAVTPATASQATRRCHDAPEVSSMSGSSRSGTSRIISVRVSARAPQTGADGKCLRPRRAGSELQSQQQDERDLEDHQGLREQLRLVQPESGVERGDRRGDETCTRTGQAASGAGDERDGPRAEERGEQLVLELRGKAEHGWDRQHDYEPGWVLGAGRARWFGGDR